MNFSVKKLGIDEIKETRENIEQNLQSVNIEIKKNPKFNVNFV